MAMTSTHEDHQGVLTLAQPRLHIGYTGTQYGMSEKQTRTVHGLVNSYNKFNVGFCAHHGDCVGGDCEFHQLCRQLKNAMVKIAVHPGMGPRARCDGDEIHPVKANLVRNKDIVDASSIMIAAPYLDEPQHRGGTWSTIRYALAALQRHLQELYVVGRNGQLIDHTQLRLREAP